MASGSEFSIELHSNSAGDQRKFIQSNLIKKAIAWQTLKVTTIDSVHATQGISQVRVLCGENRSLRLGLKRTLSTQRRFLIETDRSVAFLRSSIMSHLSLAKGAIKQLKDESLHTISHIKSDIGTAKVQADQLGSAVQIARRNIIHLKQLSVHNKPVIIEKADAVDLFLHSEY